MCLVQISLLVITFPSHISIRKHYSSKITSNHLPLLHVTLFPHQFTLMIEDWGGLRVYGFGDVPRGGHSLVYFAYTCDNDLLKWGLFTYEKGL
jgi:hypothetical protein